MCGRQGSLVKANVEGILLEVCDLCAGHGKVVKEPEQVYVKRKTYTYDENFGVPVYEEVIISDYSKLVKDAREKLGLTHQELGQKMAERESVISNVETGSLRPDMMLVKKLQRALGIKLLEKVEV